MDAAAVGPAIAFALLAAATLAFAWVMAVRVRSRRLRAVGATLFAMNGLVAIVTGLVFLAGATGVTPWFNLWNDPTFLLIVVFAIVFVREDRAWRPWELALAWGFGVIALALVAWNVAFLAGSPAAADLLPLAAALTGRYKSASFVAALLLFAVAFARSRSTAFRRQAAFAFSGFMFTAVAVGPTFAAEAGLLATVLIVASAVRRREWPPVVVVIAAFVGAILWDLLVAFARGADATGRWPLVAIVAAYTLVRPALFAYGALKYDLFDIDLRVKRGIRRASVASAFLAVFLVVAVVAENWFTETWGVAMGGAAAGLLLFALRPIERAAHRLADRAMPGVRDDDAYAVYRRVEIYKAALARAQEDGVVTERESAILEGLRRDLGITEADHARLAADLSRGAAARTA